MTKAIDTKQELMRQHMISQLLDLGIKEDAGTPVQNLNYLKCGICLRLPGLRKGENHESNNII
ncbi:hypothetical protein NST81_02770 [Bacillus sp. FSL W8-0223]|uniref:hypothetical protein n=1 Tax=Bacillus sp. FSL W8-0223 TaxID=2954595 RepID=UPI0030FC266C